MIAPNHFIPIAEETGLIIQLGDWVLRQACRDAARWTSACVAVNLSPVQFRNPDLVASVKAALEAGGLARTSPRARDHRIRAAAEQRDDARDAARAARARHQDFARRFRHRLFVAELSAQLPVRQDQDRPLLRQRIGHPQGFAGDHPRGRRSRQEPRHGHDRGGRRDRRPARPLEPRGLHAGTGLSDQQAASDRGSRAHADRCRARARWRRAFIHRPSP